MEGRALSIVSPILARTYLDQSMLMASFFKRGLRSVGESPEQVSLWCRPYQTGRTNVGSVSKGVESHLNIVEPCWEKVRHVALTANVCIESVGLTLHLNGPMWMLSFFMRFVLRGLLLCYRDEQYHVCSQLVHHNV